MGAKVFTKLDLRDAYYRISIEEFDVQKIAFRTRYSYFEYLIISFELTNASITFQVYINDALKGLLDVIYMAYMDDIIIFSDNLAQYTQYVREILTRLREYDLFVKLSKCVFNNTELIFLDYRISIIGVSMDPQRVQTI